MEQTEPYTIKVIVLTMNRPQSLLRLLRSIKRTYFEYPGDRLEVEIHVDKSHGLYYQDCVNIAGNFSLPAGRGSVRSRIAETNRGLRAAWFDGWRPGMPGEHAIILEDDLERGSAVLAAFVVTLITVTFFGTLVAMLSVTMSLSGDYQVPCVMILKPLLIDRPFS